MRIGILGSPNSWYVSDLRRAAANRHELCVCSFSDLHSFSDRDHSRVWCDSLDLSTVDALIVRSMPPGSLEQIVFRMDALATCHARGVSVVNPPKSLETAIDKYLCLERLKSAGLNVPPTIACQSADEAMRAFDRLGGDVVLKPLFGGEGRGITRFHDSSFAQHAFRLLEKHGSIIYLQPFIPHQGSDWRLLTIGDDVFGMRRTNHDDWRTNVSLGAICTPLSVTPELKAMALQAAKAVNAPVCGLDLLPGKDGRLYALEANAVPGWRALSNTLAIDIAEKVVRYIELLVSRPSPP